MPFSKYAVNNLTKVWKNEAPAKATALYVQLHTANPGENCTTSVAKESKRKAITLSAISEGEIKNTAVIEWLEVAETEEVSHASVWDAETEGNPQLYGELTKKVALTKGQDARFQVEKLALKLLKT
jgi:hypothetical protein